MTSYERIEKLRKNKGISQGKLEKELGFSNGLISKWRISTPKQDKLEKIADYFNVSLDYLITGKNSDTEIPSDFTDKELDILQKYAMLSNKEKDIILGMIDSLIDKKGE